MLAFPHLGQKESRSLSQWWGVHFISRKFISCLRKKEAWILMTAFYVIFLRPGVQKLTSGGIKLILGFSKDKMWFCSKNNVMVPEASTVLGSEVFSKWFVSAGQISISLEQQRTPESALMFGVVVAVLLVVRLSRGNVGSRALSPETFLVFLRLSAWYLIPDVKTDKRNIHILSFLKASFIQACTLKYSEKNCWINMKLLSDKLKLFDYPM